MNVYAAQTRSRTPGRAALLALGALLLVAAPALAQECSPTQQQEAEQSYSTAYQFVTANQWDEATPSLEQAVEACPSHWSSVELLAQARLRAKKYVDASSLYRRLIEGRNGGNLLTADPTLLKYYGRSLLGARRWDDAEAVYTAMLTLEPGNAEAHQMLVYKFDKTNEPEKAIDHLKSLFELAQTDAERSDYATKVGNAYKLAGDEASAKEWYDRGGGGSRGQFDIGVEHMEKQEWAEAASSFESFLEGKADSAAGWKNLGKCYQKLDRRSDAVQAYERVLELDPSRHDVVSSLGFLYLDVEQWGKAGRLAQNALDSWPADDAKLGSMYYLMGKVLEKRDANYEGAIEMFERALSDAYWGQHARKEITRQEQLIQIREMKSRQQGR